MRTGRQAGLSKRRASVAQRARAAVARREVELAQVPQRARRLQRALGLGQHGDAGAQPALGRRGHGRGRGPACGLRGHCGSSARASVPSRRSRLSAVVVGMAEHDARRCPRPTPRPRRSGPAAHRRPAGGHARARRTGRPSPAPRVRRAARPCASTATQTGCPADRAGGQRQVQRLVVVEQVLFEQAAQRRAQPRRGRLGQGDACQLTSVSASTATTLSALGSSAACARPGCRRAGRRR